jgi:hypothetical protein
MKIPQVKMLVKYVRVADISPAMVALDYNSARQPVGCIVCLNKDMIGWSKCNTKDRFSKSRAVEVAKGRAMYNIPLRHKRGNEEVGLPVECLAAYEELMQQMKVRADRYFKDE